MTAIRARIEPTDAVLLMLGFGALLMLLQQYHSLAIFVGAAIAYTALIISLVIIPRRWFDD